MWVAYSRPRRATTAASAYSSPPDAFGLGRVLEAGREPDGPGIEARLELARHHRQLVGPRRRGDIADREESQVAERHERRDVDRGTRSLERAEIPVHRAPVELADALAPAVDVAGDPGIAGVGDRRAAMAAVADDLGGHALAQRALGLGVDQQREVGVAVDVDEAGGDDAAAGLDPPTRLRRREVAERDDPVTDHPDIRADCCAPQPIDDVTTRDDDVEPHRSGCR